MISVLAGEQDPVEGAHKKHIEKSKTETDLEGSEEQLWWERL